MLDIAILDISKAEFTAGLTYVAISRVKKLTRLLFEKLFDLLLLKQKGSPGADDRNNDRVDRSRQLVRYNLDFNDYKGGQEGSIGSDEGIANIANLATFFNLLGNKGF